MEELIVNFINQAQKRVIVAGQEQALLQAYIFEWGKFFTQSSYLPLPFWQLETSLQVLINNHKLNYTMSIICFFALAKNFSKS